MNHQMNLKTILITRNEKPELINELNCWEVCKFLTNVPHPYSNKDAEYWLKLTNEREFQSNNYYKKSLITGIFFKQLKLYSQIFLFRKFFKL